MRACVLSKTESQHACRVGMQHNADAAERAVVVSSVGCRVSGVTWHGFTSCFPSPLAWPLSTGVPSLTRLGPRTGSSFHARCPCRRASCVSVRRLHFCPQHLASRTFITHADAYIISARTHTSFMRMFAFGFVYISLRLHSYIYLIPTVFENVLVHAVPA